MNYGAHELSTSGLATLALPFFFLAPGYLASFCLNLFHFRAQTRVERLLWSISLSLPLSLLAANHPGLPITPHTTTTAFVLCLALSTLLLVRDHRIHREGESADDAAALRSLGLTAVGLTLYCLLAVAPICTRTGVSESSVWQDWGVRVQLVNAAIRGGNHPGNPMFALAGIPPPLHYYYYWYVLCARMHDVVPVDARAVLTASCVGSSFALFAFLLLSAKYMLGPQRQASRSQTFALFLGSCIIGLDLFPWVVALAFHRTYANLQFWLSDRSPGFLHMVLWSPHHVAGLVSCGMGTLLLTRLDELGLRKQVVPTILAAVCFAAAAGTSTFITLLFASACLLLVIDAALHRRWSFTLRTIGAGLLALVLDASFLRTTLLSPAVSQSARASHTRLITFWPRYAHQSLAWVRTAIVYLNTTLRHRPVDLSLPTQYVWTQRLLRPPVALLLFFLDFGLFAFVLLWQVRRDFVHRQGPLTQKERNLWLIFIGIAVPGCLLNSAGIQDNNDLGRHAGFCMRYVLLLWATPTISALFEKRVNRTNFLQGVWAGRLAYTFGVLGLVGQLTQVILDRVQMPLTDAGVLPPVMVATRVPHASERFLEFETGMAEATKMTPYMGTVQYNPHSRFNAVFLLYTDRQLAASDDGCNTPFGGDTQACESMTRAIDALFGGTGRHFQGASKLLGHVPFLPDAVTPENFRDVCTAYRIDTLVANYADPVWQSSTSWVWTLPPVFANRGLRVFHCPPTSIAASSGAPFLSSTP